jgi:hypothetical protein
MVLEQIANFSIVVIRFLSSSLVTNYKGENV